MRNYIKKGFTLIELLVVISIIGLLSSIIVSSLNASRVKARDAERIQTLQEIRKALTLYYDDNGHYPVAASFINGSHVDRTALPASWTNLSIELKKYIPTLPKDPKRNTGLPPSYIAPKIGYSYWTDATGSKYQLMARLENSNPLSCSKNNYKATVPYGNVFFGPLLGQSLCGIYTLDYTNINKNLYVISSGE